MKKPGVVIFLATIYAMVFNASPFLGIPPSAILLMFILSPFIMIYMAYVVLRFGKPSKYTFDQRWYDDVEAPVSVN